MKTLSLTNLVGCLAAALVLLATPGYTQCVPAIACPPDITLADCDTSPAVAGEPTIVADCGSSLTIGHADIDLGQRATTLAASYYAKTPNEVFGHTESFNGISNTSTLPAGWVEEVGNPRIFNGTIQGSSGTQAWSARYETTEPIQANTSYTVQFEVGVQTSSSSVNVPWQVRLGTVNAGVFTPLQSTGGSVVGANGFDQEREDQFRFSYTSGAVVSGDNLAVRVEGLGGPSWLSFDHIAVFETAMDPQAQGWAWTQGGNRDFTGHPIDNDLGLGINAWQVEDFDNSGGSIQYRKTLTTADETSADANGYVIRVVGRFVNDNADSWAVLTSYGNGSNRHLIWYDHDSNNNLQIALNGNTSGGTFLLTTTADDGNDYHEFLIIKEAGSSNASVYFDGQLVVSAWPGQSNGQTDLIIGTGSTGGQGRMNYHSVEMFVGADETLCAGETTLLRTWTVADANGTPGVPCSQLITIEDTTGPVLSGVVPAIVNVQCDVNIPNVPTVTAIDSCEGALGEVALASTSDTGAGTCPRTIVRTWTISDTCGNSTTETQTITVKDTENPTIGCPADVNVNNDAGLCTASGVNLGTPTTGDNCGVDSVSNDAPAVFSVGTTVVTWTVKDKCGNSATCKQNVTVNDNEAPQLVCPQDALVQCGLDLSDPANTGGYATAPDNCDASPAIDFVDTYPDLFLHLKLDEATTAADSSGHGNDFDLLNGIVTGQTGQMGLAAQFDGSNDNGISQSLDIIPATASQYAISCWINTTSGGGGDHIVSIEGVFVIIYNNGGIMPIFDGSSGGDPNMASGLNDGEWHHLVAQNLGTVTVLYVDGAFAGSPPETLNVTALQSLSRRTGVGSQWDGAKEFGGLIDDVTVWGRVLSLAEIEKLHQQGLTGTDATPSPCPGPQIITRTWTAADADGNSTSCEQTITVQDTTAPVITCPDDVTIECDVNPTPANTQGPATANDNCDAAPAISHVDNVTSLYRASSDDVASNPLNQGWAGSELTAPGADVDLNGFIDSTDNNGPVLTTGGAPAWQLNDQNGDGSYNLPQLRYDFDPTQTAVMDANGFTIILKIERLGAKGFLSFGVNNGSGTTLFGTTAVNEYRFGLSPNLVPPDGAVHTISWTWDPVLEQMARSVDGGTPTVIAPTATTPVYGGPIVGGSRFMLDAGSSSGTTAKFNITQADIMVGSDCDQTIVRTWTATDDCGNTDTCVQIITVQDTTAPIITCPGDKVVECDASLDPAFTGSPQVSDNCGSTTISFVDSDAQDNLTNLGTLDSIDFAWRYEMSVPPNNQDLDGNGTDDWWDAGAPPVAGGLAVGTSGKMFRGDFDGSIWRAGLPNGDYTIEFRIQILNSGSEGSSGTFSFWGEKPFSANNGLRLNLARNGQDTSNGSTLDVDLGSNNNTDGFHVFRIAHVGAGYYFIWRDGVLLNPGGTLIEGNNNYINDGIFGGDYSSSLGGNWLLDYMRLSGGAFAPTQPGVTGSGDGVIARYDAGLAPATVPDPTDAGFALEHLGGGSTGPVANDVGGYNAWQVVDSGNTPSGTRPQFNVDEQQVAAARENGWVLKARVRPISSSQILQYAEANGTHRWGLYFRSSGGWLRVETFGGDNWTDVGTPADQYNVIEMINYGGNNDETYIAINGKILPFVYTGQNSGNSIGGVTFGSGTSSGSNLARYNLVEFKVNNGVTATGCPEDGMILRTWTAVDECGNASSCVQNIFIQDVTAPSITCPRDVTLECDVQPTVANTQGPATATDNCDSDPDVTSVDDPHSSGFPTAPSSSFSVQFNGNEIWNAGYLNGWGELNGGGTTESLNGTVLHYDHSGSGIATTLDGTFSTADSGATTWNTGNNGDWSMEISIRFNDIPNGFALWQGVDTDRIVFEAYNDRTQDFGAGTFNAPHINNDGKFHVYRVAHDSAANRYHVWRDGVRLTGSDGVPYDFSSNDNRLLFGDYTSGSFGNNFDVDIAYIRYDQMAALAPDACTGEVITRTWTATDDCGNSRSCAQTITILDTLPPSITCPRDATLECPADTSPTAIGSASGLDNCGATTITHSDIVTPGCGNTYSIKRTWTATDECGNSDSCDQEIAVQDTKAPVLSGCPSDASYVCLVDVPPPADVKANDDCDGPVAVDYLQVPANPDTDCNLTITRTWSATDACGNTSEICTQVITVNDEVAPVLTSVPPAPAYNEVDCSGVQTLSDSGASGGTVTYTGSVDLPDPLPTELPPLPVVTALDNCDGAVIPELDGFADPADCPGTVNWIWTATDRCGNSAELIHLVLLKKACVETTKYWEANPDRWLNPGGPVTELDLRSEDCQDAELILSQVDALALLEAKSHGDPSIKLAQELIAAMLNVEQGADATLAADLIVEAKQLLCLLNTYPEDKALKKAAKDLAKDLKDYNKGKLNVPACISGSGGSGE